MSFLYKEKKKFRAYSSWRCNQFATGLIVECRNRNYFCRDLKNTNTESEQFSNTNVVLIFVNTHTHTHSKPTRVIAIVLSLKPFCSLDCSVLPMKTFNKCLYKMGQLKGQTALKRKLIRRLARLGSISKRRFRMKWKELFWRKKKKNVQ
jgi:hypothetical protein